MFLPAGELSQGQSEDDAIETELSSIPTLSTGILSATQGVYKTAQLLLDITQGARVSYSAYSPANPPLLSLSLSPNGPSSSASVTSWTAVLKRADSAPQLLDPGLLATEIPGGGAYAAAGEHPNVDGVVAADRAGHVAAVSLGPPSTLLARIARLRATHSLVVADLAAGAAGYGELRALAATRPSGELLIAVQRAPDRPGHELLWIALAGLGREAGMPAARASEGGQTPTSPTSEGSQTPTSPTSRGSQTLTSQTTNEHGLIAAIDVGPTILAHLLLPSRPTCADDPCALDGAFDGSALRGLKAPLDGDRLAPAAGGRVAARRMGAVLVGATALPLGRRSPQAPRLCAESRRALDAVGPRGGAPPRGARAEPTAEFALIVGVCFALGALTDRLVPWPRAPAVVALVAVLALTIDALAGTQLLMRSLLGPKPAFGARFYGIGNELKSGLAVLVFAGVAAMLYPAVRRRRAALAMACAGIALAIVEGSARIGAGVGGVILVSAGTAVASVMLLPGAVNRKRILIVTAAPVAGLVALAALDLLTAHGGGHFTGSVLDARSAGDIRDILVRRYGAAWDELKNHLMPFATALALGASAYGVRRRERICAPVDSDPAWPAALAGGLTAGVIGALTEDSGPVLLVVAVFALGCVLAYLWGTPRRQPPRSEPEVASSRANPPGNRANQARI